MDLCRAPPRPKSFGVVATAGFATIDSFSETVGIRIVGDGEGGGTSAVPVGGAGGEKCDDVTDGDLGAGSLPLLDGSLDFGGSGFLTSPRRLASNVASTSARGVAYLARDATMMAWASERERLRSRSPLVQPVQNRKRQFLSFTRKTVRR